jgi:hypothetical protein
VTANLTAIFVIDSIACSALGRRSGFVCPMLPPRLGVARVATEVLLASVAVAVGLFLAPSVGLQRRPRACIWVSFSGAALSTVVLLTQVAFPLTQGALLAWPQDYFLAMAHSFQPDTPYPFFWSQRWAYVLGTLSPLIAAGGVLALGAGYSALRAGERVAVLPTAVGVCSLVAFVIGAALTASWTWYGVPV